MNCRSLRQMQDPLSNQHLTSTKDENNALPPLVRPEPASPHLAPLLHSSHTAHQPDAARAAPVKAAWLESTALGHALEQSSETDSGPPVTNTSTEHHSDAAAAAGASSPLESRTTMDNGPSDQARSSFSHVSLPGTVEQASLPSDGQSSGVSVRWQSETVPDNAKAGRVKNRRISDGGEDLVPEYDDLFAKAKGLLC